MILLSLGQLGEGFELVEGVGLEGHNLEEVGETAEEEDEELGSARE
jgi:hypothetical protein